MKTGQTVEELKQDLRKAASSIFSFFDFSQIFQSYELSIKYEYRIKRFFFMK